MTELERCDAEIHQMKLLLCDGHPDIEGLLLALVDWRTELRLLRAKQENDDGLPRTDPKTKRD